MQSKMCVNNASFGLPIAGVEFASKAVQRILVYFNFS